MSGLNKRIRLFCAGMALLGSMFSILQVIPDAHRVVRDILEQVAALLNGADSTALIRAG